MTNLDWIDGQCGYCVFKSEPRKNGYSECRYNPPSLNREYGVKNYSSFPVVGGGTSACSKFVEFLPPKESN